MEKIYNVAAYARESRDEHFKKLSTLENQLQILKNFIENQPQWQLYDLYADDNVSGTTFVRPELNRLISDADSGRIDIILLKDLSRLGRNNGQTLLFLDWAEEKGIQIITTDGRYNSNSNTELAGIDTWFNERYAADISHKIRATLKMKIQQGEYIGTAPYGYRKKSPGKLEPDPSEAVFVQEIYNLYLKGFGYEKICDYLKNKNVPPPKTNWSPQTVARILSSKVYIGTTVQGVSKKQNYKSRKTIRLSPDQWTVTENTHTSIIDSSIYMQVQEEKRRRQKGYGNNRGKIPVFKNVLFCGLCGEKMYSKGTGYICSKYVKNGAGTCLRNFHFTRHLISEILPQIQEVISTLDLDCNVNSETKNALLNDAKLNCEKRLEVLYNDRLKGVISLELYKKLSKREEDLYKNLTTESEKENVDFKSLKEKFLNETENSIPPELFRLILSAMVEKCIVK